MNILSQVFYVIIFIVLSNHIKAQKTIKSHVMYESAEEPKEDIRYELIQYGKIRNESASMGDFLSRLWDYFGKPKRILFEGFEYSLRDKKSGLHFIASQGASGAAFFGKKKDIEKLKPIIAEFELFLDNAKNVDCEIEIDTDFGIYLSGAKDGIAYDKETTVYNLNPSDDERLITLFTELRTSLEDHLKNSNPTYTQKDINECVNVLVNYSVDLQATNSKEDAVPILKSAIQKLNVLNKGCNYSLIETGERELIAEIMILIGHKKGYNATDEDITEEWREW